MDTHPERGAGRPKYEVADIVVAHGDELERQHELWPEQHKALTAMARCRTVALGGHLDVCDGCGHSRPSYNSCRNRHCPKCQALAQQHWIDDRMERVLAVEHFHVVFTVPSALRPLVAFRRRELFGALFHSSADALLELGQSRLGALLGITAVLHTWTRELSWHPHVHCIVTAGGLSLDGSRWARSSPKYLLPVNQLGALLRGKMMDAVRWLHRRGVFTGFDDFDDPEGFDRLMGKLAKAKWVVYAKKPFGRPDHLFSYLGRYTHRVGIANSRLRHVDHEHVTFATKNGKTITLAPLEFLRRLVRHVLPPNFVKIRHYGLYASSHVHGLLDTARAVLQASAIEARGVSIPLVLIEPLLIVLERLARACPRCGERLHRRPLPALLDTS